MSSKSQDYAYKLALKVHTSKERTSEPKIWFTDGDKITISTGNNSTIGIPWEDRYKPLSTLL